MSLLEPKSEAYSLDENEVLLLAKVVLSPHLATEEEKSAAEVLARDLVWELCG